MPSGLVTLAQDDFAAGAFQSIARHLISSRGLVDCENGLYDEDGSIYKRGGSEYVSTADFGTRLRWLWDGYFAAGQRTLISTSAAFGVLDAGGAPVALGGAGLAEPKAAAQVGGILFFAGGIMYAGSRKAADYVTGTVSVVNGSKVVTGAGTAFSANVDAGMLLRVAGAGRYYVVASVDSNTQITLAEPVEVATAGGLAYALTRLGSAQSHGARTAEIYVSAGDRLVTIEGSRVYVSNNVDPTTGSFRTHVWDPLDFHEIPGGAQGIAGAALRDRLLVFTTTGLWSISNLAFNIVDAGGNNQRRVERIAADLIAWGAGGIATSGNSLVVAATDGVYVVDGISAPLALHDSIARLYRRYVGLGYKPGAAAVFKGHLFLPVLNAGNAIIDLLVCRLDRSVQTSTGLVFAWSRMNGHGGSVPALAARSLSGSVRSPDLLAVGGARVLSLAAFFEPVAAVKLDADGSEHVFVLETRDYAPGGGTLATLTRRMRCRYELTDAGSDNPMLLAEFSIGTLQGNVPLWNAVNWNSFTWGSSVAAEFRALANGAPEDDGRRPFTWDVEAHARFIRYRIRSSGPSATLVIRSIESFVRESAKAA